MMHAIAAVLPQFLVLIALLVLAYVPLGSWMARSYTSERDWAVERGIYAILRVDPSRGHSSKNYARALLGFSLASVLALYLVQRLQTVLPSFGNARDTAVEPWMAFNTAASFVSNTNWQSYSGEDTLTNATQMLGLTVQNFASAAVGMSVACLLYTSPSPRDATLSRMPSSA